LDSARKSAATPSAGRSVFSAVSGRNTAGHSRSALTHFEYPTSALWSDPDLIEHAQATFRGPGADWRETAWPKLPNQAPPTFLAEMTRLLTQRNSRGRYVYNEQEYSLELEFHKPTRERVPLLPVRGKIRNLRTSHETPFRLWLENGSASPVPVRIEFQARSFLRLTFEAIPA